MSSDAVRALRAGQAVILPTDTVYGLVCDAHQEDALRRLYALKQRSEAMPCALLGDALEVILAALPELEGRPLAVARALLPGPYTLVLPNPARRFRHLCGDAPQAIGIRVPELPAAARAVLARTGVVAATSANLHGGPDPALVDDVPEAIRVGAGAIVDVGELPGTPSTVLDLTSEPRVLREGAVPAAVALERVRTAG
jgi:L-threonylcarbamoyladenylate synthase